MEFQNVNFSKFFQKQKSTQIEFQNVHFSSFFPKTKNNPNGVSKLSWVFFKQPKSSFETGILASFFKNKNNPSFKTCILAGFF